MTIQKNKCVHHWIFETPNGPEVRGVCKKCGAEKVSPAYEDWWDRKDKNRPNGRRNITVNSVKDAERRQ